MNIYEEYNKISNKISLKNERNQLLIKTDKYMLSDFPITPEQLDNTDKH